MTQISYAGGKLLKYTYDAAGRRTKMEDQSGFTVSYSYDAIGRLSSLADGAGNILVTYSYDVVGYLRSKQNGDGSKTTYDLDAAGQLTYLINFDGNQEITSRFDYQYDALGQPTSVGTLEGVWSYSYDAAGQLRRAVFTSNNAALIPHQDLVYNYDAAGNRTSTLINGVTTAYSANSMNQYTAVGSATYAYDADGNLIRKTAPGIVTTFAYDPENQLVGIAAPGDAWSYQYDPIGNLVATTHNGSTIGFVTDPAGLGNAVGEYNSAGALQAHYIHGGDLVSRVASGGATSFYQFDGTGNTVGILGAGGGLSSSFSYLPFGDILKATNPSSTAFQFGGGLGVMKWGANLYSMRARSYNPGLGRFVQADPLGINAGPNVYTYAGNSPVLANDPSGLMTLFELKILRIALAQQGIFEGLSPASARLLSTLGNAIDRVSVPDLDLEGGAIAVRVFMCLNVRDRRRRGRPRRRLR